jgi:hypothetical protein
MEVRFPRHGNEKVAFAPVNGRFLENPMSNPPIRASRWGVVKVLEWWKLVSMDDRILFKRFEMKR